MSPQKQLSHFIDTILLTYALSKNTDVEEALLEDYRKLSEKCDNIISKIRERKEKMQNT